MFINDGSSDSTWDIIKTLSKKNKHIIGACLSSNRGHQNAILAGLMEAKDKRDITITLDCDGQHDINAVDMFLDKYLEGYEVVYGVRNDRAGDSIFKKIFSEMYYVLINALGGQIIPNHADYRLVSSRVLNEFEEYKEVNVFLRGLFPLVGFKSTTVNYDQLERTAGKSHYSLSKMLTLATDGITSLSIKPLRIITVVGILISITSFIGLVFSGISRDELWITANLICFVIGVLQVSIGIVGEYVGKAYMETNTDQDTS